MPTDLLIKSLNWKKDATKVLKDSNLLELLKKHGEVEFTGSYAYDLMLCSDVDIFWF